MMASSTAFTNFFSETATHRVTYSLSNVRRSDSHFDTANASEAANVAPESLSTG